MKRLFVLASHTTALLLLFGFSLRLWRNLRFLNRSQVSARDYVKTSDSPVSVLVPARNEAHTISACVDSLVQQDYPHFELLVLNDQSTDQTGLILDRLAAQEPRLEVIHGAESPPPGWNGKSYACQRLAQQASGDWLLFTDADTLHSPTSIAQGVALAESLGVDLLSVFPRQITVSWSERVVVSFILDFLPLIGLNLPGLWRGDADNTAANGQYMLVHNSSYRAVGGHGAVASALVDDFALAKLMRAQGYRIALADGTAMLSCRMYRSAGEVWQGFSKNILLALDMSSAERRSRLWGLAFAWAYASLFVLPFAFVFSRYRRLSLWIIIWLASLRGVLNWRLQRPFLEILTTPLAAWGVMAFGLNVFVRRFRGDKVRWKDRDYPLNT